MFLPQKTDPCTALPDIADLPRLTSVCTARYRKPKEHLVGRDKGLPTSLAGIQDPRGIGIVATCWSLFAIRRQRVV